MLLAAQVSAGKGTLVAGGVRLEPQDGNALLHLIRARISPEQTPPIRNVPPSFDVAAGLPLIVSVYRAGSLRCQRAAMLPTLRESAEGAADQLRRFFSKLPQGDAALAEGLIHVDVVVRRRPIKARSRLLLGGELKIGLDGLLGRDGDRRIFFSPITVMRHRRSVDILKAVFLDQESAPPPEDIRLHRFRTTSFVEEKPRGRALPLYRGNVLLDAPHPDSMIRAVSHTGLWLLNTQQDDGSFPPTWHPAVEKAGPVNRMDDHMRALLAVLALRQLTGDERLAKASEEAIRFAKTHLREQKDRAFTYVADKDDPVTASALLLTCLCFRALTEPEPTADGLMRQLAQFLLVMTTPKGKLYSTVNNALKERAHHEPRGEPYAETLIALTLLQQISPTPEARRACRSIADLLATLPDSLPRVRNAHQVWPRTIEALAQYYTLTRVASYGKAAVALAERLAGLQLVEPRATYPDYVGGFAEPDMPPDASLTAAATSAMAAAYEVNRIMRRSQAGSAATVRQSALFLMNMQYRPENTFFLRYPARVLGAYRNRPEDLSLRLASAADAVRALTSAATIVAETTTGPP